MEDPTCDAAPDPVNGQQWRIGWLQVRHLLSAPIDNQSKLQRSHPGSIIARAHNLAGSFRHMSEMTMLLGIDPVLMEWSCHTSLQALVQYFEGGDDRQSKQEQLARCSEG